MEISQSGIDVRYVILYPNEETVISRVRNRNNADFNDHDNINMDALTPEVLKSLHDAFSDHLSGYEAHVVNNTTETVDESVEIIQKMLAEKKFALR